METRLEYAPKGLIGVLTPQANTTVEPELSILKPPGIALITARLTSNAAAMQDRLRDYGDSIGRALEQFANAPVSVAAFACTGASYLVEVETERARLSDIAKRQSIVVITAAQALLDGLNALGASRVGLISPYGGDLHETALHYWQARGLEIADVAQLPNVSTAFHPIYAQAAGSCAEVLGQMTPKALEAIVILGTGLPSLPAILGARDSSIPVLSPNLCLMWRCMTVLTGATPNAESLRPWLTGTAWGERLNAQSAR